MLCYVMNVLLPVAFWTVSFQRVLPTEPRPKPARCLLGNGVLYVTPFRVTQRHAGSRGTTERPTVRSSLADGVTAAKMLSILPLLLLFFSVGPVCCVFQKLYCSISESCDCDFKPNIRGKTFVLVLKLS